MFQNNFSQFNPANFSAGNFNPADFAKQLQQQWQQNFQQPDMKAFFDGSMFKDAFKMFEGLKPAAGAAPKMDYAELLQAQKRNAEAMAAANQVMVQGMQQLVQRQMDIWRDTLQTASGLMSDLVATGTPEEKLARQADLAKQAFELATQNMRDLAELMNKSQTQAFNVVAVRVNEGLDELKATAQKMKK